MKTRTTALILFVTTFAALSVFAAYQSGCYCGLSAGFGALYGDRTDRVDQTGTVRNISDDANINNTKIALGGFLGYLYRFDGSPYFVSAEADLIYNPNDDTQSKRIGGFFGDYTVKLSRKLQIDVPFKLGAHFHDCYAVYLLLGPSFSCFKYDVDDVVSGTTFSFDTSETLFGISYGIGLERELQELPIRIGVELKNTHYRKKRFEVRDDVNSEDIFLESGRFSVFSLALRAAYLF